MARRADPVVVRPDGTVGSARPRPPTRAPDLEVLLAKLRPAFHADALCRMTPSVNFFPERGESAEPAKAICAECPVIGACRAWALREGSHLVGVWGGLSARERRRRGSMAEPAADAA